MQLLGLPFWLTQPARQVVLDTIALARMAQALATIYCTVGEAYIHGNNQATSVSKEKKIEEYRGTED